MRRGPTAEQVIEVVCGLYNITRAEILGRQHAFRISHPRQLAAYIISKHCDGMSLPRIGRILGGKDHTTIVHAKAAIGRRLLSNPEVAEAYLEAVRRLDRMPRPALPCRVRPAEPFISTKAQRMTPYTPPGRERKARPAPMVRPPKVGRFSNPGLAPSSVSRPAAKQGTPKTRACLMCNGFFNSEWAGDRVCKFCKSTETWKCGGSSIDIGGRL